MISRSGSTAGRESGVAGAAPSRLLLARAVPAGTSVARARRRRGRGRRARPARRRRRVGTRSSRTTWTRRDREFHTVHDRAATEPTRRARRTPSSVSEPRRRTAPGPAARRRRACGGETVSRRSGGADAGARRAGLSPHADDRVEVLAHLADGGASSRRIAVYSASSRPGAGRRGRNYPSRCPGRSAQPVARPPGCAVPAGRFSITDRNSWVSRSTRDRGRVRSSASRRPRSRTMAASTRSGGVRVGVIEAWPR